VIPAEVETQLGRSDGNWALACNERSEFDRLLEALLRCLSHLAQETASEGFGCREVASSESQLSRPAVVADDFLEALKSANIGSKGKIDLLDAELGFLRGNPDVRR